MIDSNNQFKKLSADLVASARSIMEKKTNKHGHDPVGKEDADIDNDGDVDASDKYLHNRRKAIAKNMKKEEVERIDELSKKTLASYAKKAGGTGLGSAAGNALEYARVANDPSTSIKARMKPMRKAINRARGVERAVDQLTKEEVESIDEALDAAARYGQHHTAIKELMKSIDHHVRNHKDNALKHKNYQGKKGVHWGHVGDLAQVHSQLADIHDRLAQQGEYKKSMNESVEDIIELSKSTMGSYTKKAADDFRKRKPKMGYDGQLKKMQNRNVGVKRALDKMYGEDVELDEAPVAGVAAGSMENGAHMCATKVFHEELGEGTTIYSQHAEPDAYGNVAWYDVMFEHGIVRHVPTNEMEILMSESHERHGKRKMKEEAELDEARGRPRKNPLPTGQESDEPEPRQHIMQQLQRAKLSMHGSSPVKFKDGTTHDVHGKHAAHLLSKYSDMKPYEKEAFQKKIGQSHANLKSEL